MKFHPQGSYNNWFFYSGVCLSTIFTIIDITYIIFKHVNHGFFKLSYEYVYYIQ